MVSVFFFLSGGDIFWKISCGGFRARGALTEDFWKISPGEKIFQENDENWRETHFLLEKYCKGFYPDLEGSSCDSVHLFNWCSILTVVLKIVGESIHVSLRAAKEPDFTRQRSVHENQRPASEFLWNPIKFGMELQYEYVSWKFKKFPASGKFSSPYGLLRWRGFKKFQEISWNEKNLLGWWKCPKPW